MDYLFGSDSWGASFSVPWAVVNKFLKDCNEVQLKVLLCIFAGSRMTDTTALSAACGAEEREVDCAVEYWRSRGVITVNGGIPERMTGSESSASEVNEQGFSAKNEPVSLVEAVKPSSKVIEKKVAVRYSQRELKEKIDKDSELSQLTNEIQSILQFSINGKELEDLVNLYDYYKFDVPSILLCAEYCASAGKKKISYLYTVMVRWFEQDITSYSDVEQAIISLNVSRDYQRKVLRIFGVESKPSPTQRDMIDKWRTLGVSPELVEIAYNKCMDANNKLAYKYIDKIITNWTQKSISTKEQVERSDEDFKAKNSSKAGNKQGSTSYDLDEFENFALNFGLSDNSGKD